MCDTEVTTKKCSKCGIEKSFENYHKHSEGKYGLRPDCRDCCHLRKKEHYHKNKEKYAVANKLKRETNPEYYREYSKEYQKSHSVELKAKSKSYREKNKEAIRERNRLKYSNEEYRQGRLAYHKEWYSKNYESRKANYVAGWNKRHAQQLKATPIWADNKAILQLYKDREHISKETGIIHHVDHIIPLQGKMACGLHVPDNLRIVPASENLKKSNKLIEEIK